MLCINYMQLNSACNIPFSKYKKRKYQDLKSLALPFLLTKSRKKYLYGAGFANSAPLSGNKPEKEKK